MTDKETNLKEKFKQALESTARVISDDLSIKEKSKDVLMYDSKTLKWAIGRSLID